MSISGLISMCSQLSLLIQVTYDSCEPPMYLANPVAAAHLPLYSTRHIQLVLHQLYFSRLNCSFINTFRLPTMLFDLFLVIFLIYCDLFILPRDLWSSEKSISSKLLLLNKNSF